MSIPYHGMVWYGIETISFDFYGMVRETYWYHGMVWEISGICRVSHVICRGMGNILYTTV